MSILNQAHREVHGGIEMYTYGKYLVVMPHHECPEYTIILDEEYAEVDRTLELFLPSIAEVENFLIEAQ